MIRRTYSLLPNNFKSKRKKSKMLFETNKEKGRAGLSLAIAYFGANGYSVNIPLNDTQWYDLVIEKDGKFETVQCKATGFKNGDIDLRTTIGKGQNKNKTSYTLIDTPIDLLFCINQNKTMYCIPVDEIRKSGNESNIKLKEEPLSKFANKNCLDTYKYIVTL